MRYFGEMSGTEEKAIADKAVEGSGEEERKEEKVRISVVI